LTRNNLNLTSNLKPQIITKTIYKTKIVYENDEITKKILFQTSLFLYYTKDKLLNVNYIDGGGQCAYNDGLKSRFKNGSEVIEPTYLLKQITKYNYDNFRNK
jgi:hypothetical protein